MKTTKTLSKEELTSVLSNNKSLLLKYIPKQGKMLGSARKFNKEWYDVIKAIQSCIRHSKSRADQYKWKHNIDPQYIAEIYIKQKGICPVTGNILSPYKGSWNQKNPYKMSIDRIDSSKGYVKGNVKLVTHWANNAKNTWHENILNEFILASAKQLKKKI